MYNNPGRVSPPIHPPTHIPGLFPSPDPEVTFHQTEGREVILGTPLRVSKTSSGWKEKERKATTPERECLRCLCFSFHPFLSQPAQEQLHLDEIKAMAANLFGKQAVVEPGRKPPSFGEAITQQRSAWFVTRHSSR